MKNKEAKDKGTWCIDDLIQVIYDKVKKKPDPEHVKAGRHVDGCGYDD